MTAVVLAVLGASLLGSLHCAGMCGGLVAFYAGQGTGRRGGSHLAYNGGRLVAYVTLGLAAGAMGGILDLAGSLAGVQRTAAGMAGLLVAVWGGLNLLQALGARVPAPEPPEGLERLVRRGMRVVAARPAAERALVLGLLTGALPCGWLWAFLASAAGTGSPAGGALVMTAFWLGTLPVLVGLGAGAQALAGPLRRHVPAVCAVAMIVVGVLAVAGRVPLGGAPPHHAAPVTAETTGAPAGHGH